MTKAARWVLILALTPCILAAPALAGGDVNLLFGQAESNDGLLEETGVEGQTAFRDFGGGNEFTDVVVDDSSGDFGYWLNAGVVYTVGDHFNIGLDLRYSDADSALNPNDVEDEIRIDSGALQYTLALGYRW